MPRSQDSGKLSALKLALLANRLRERDDELRLIDAEPVAVIGMACRFPGNIDTPEQLWHLLINGGDAISEVPAARWSHAAYFDEDPAKPGKINTRFGGFVDGVERFDPMFFGIAPKEAIYMDPQHRILLEVAWEAFDDSGWPLDRLSGSRTGVFLGLYSNDYGRMQLERPDMVSAHTISGTSPSMAAGRLSYLFGLKGISMVVDTACSSSLVAVHLAMQSLRSRESDLAVAGGASLLLTPNETISLAKWGMLAPDGRCKTFDERANGFVRSEGCGLVVLKRLSDALRDGDRIQAVLRGSAVNQDGRSNVLTAPNGDAQRDVIRAALRQARVQAGDVSFVETHGTGTKVGDPIEVEALADVFTTSQQPGANCYLGAIKANVGHLEAAAGVAALIKTVLCLKYKSIPPQIHFRKLNPLITLDNTPLRIPVEKTHWEITDGGSRIAGISSFGFSGTNAHLILEEAPQLPLRGSRTQRAQLLPLSAKSEHALGATCKIYQEFLGKAEAESIADICYTAGVRRTHHVHRAAIVASSTLQMRDALHKVRQRDPWSGPPPRIAFVYSGQGSGWQGMATGLLRDEPVFARAIERCDEIIAGLATDWSVGSLLASAVDEPSWLTDTERYQVVLFAVQVALTELWRSWGIEPAAVTGHSIGEIAAAHAAGALDLESSIGLVMNRARLMKHKAGAGAMAAVGLTPARAEDILQECHGELVIAAHNAPESVTVAGEIAALEQFLNHPSVADRFVRRLAVDRAFHSPQMEQAALELEDAVRSLAPQRARIAMYSSVTGEPVAGESLGADYWRRNVRERVHFLEAVESMLADGYQWFIEIGPHPALLPGIEGAARERPVVTLPSLRRGQDDRTIMLESLARLYEAGLAVNWDKVADPDTRCISLPAYAWQNECYWLDLGLARYEPESISGSNELSPLVGRRVDSPFIDGAVFEAVLGEHRPDWLADHRLAGTSIVPATALIDMALTAGCEMFDARDGIELQDGVIHRALVLPEGEQRRVQVGIEHAGLNEWRVRIAARPAQSGGQWETHFESRLIRHSEALPSATAEQPATLAEALPLADLDALYARMDERQILFGPAFRVVASIRAGEVESAVKLSPETGPWPAGHVLYPPRLDACFHGLEPFFADSTDAWVPAGFSRIALIRRPSVIDSARLCRRQGTAIPGSELRADVTVFSDSGQPCVWIDGLRLRSVPLSALNQLTASGAEEFLHRIEWEAVSELSNHAPQGPWLIFADRGGVGEALAASLEKLGTESMLVKVGTTYEVETNRRVIDASDPDHYARVLQERAPGGMPYRIVVLLWGLDCGEIAADPLEFQADVSRSALFLMQGLQIVQDTELWLVTRGSQRSPAAAGRDQAPLWGFGAVIGHEYASLRCRLIDLDPCELPATLADALAREAQVGDREDRIAWSGGQRFAARLRPVSSNRQLLPTADAWAVGAASSGLIKDLAPSAVSVRKPLTGEVLIEVSAVGVNFRDVLNALGMLGADAPRLGGECAGRVVALGDGVDPALLGKSVMAFAMGAMASKIAVPVDQIAPIPEGMSHVEAATVPVAFLTVKYGLERLAELRQGETVLIHAATGGVGLAALQVARACGATVYATAGSETKQAYLRALGIEHVFSSRTTDFRDEVLHLTGGKGVDVVLNSLADEFVAAGVDSLARGGRFIELGKRGVWTAERMAAARPDVTYLPFDLSSVAEDSPALIAELFAELTEEFRSKRCRPLPYRSYPLDDLRDAFDQMAHAKHIGKLVISIPPARSPGLRDEATYLITGASGGLAPSLAQSLVDRGARHLALVARREPDSQLLSFIENWRAGGVQVEWFRADVANRAELDACLKQIEQEMAPLRGVFHLAGIIDDAPIATLTWERFARVMEPKLRGAWYLHELTRELPLDLFVLYSSVAAVVGWPGQSAYASGNAYLDALARWREALGLPAVSINWGPWTDAGMAVETAAARGVDFAHGGLRPLTPAEGDAGLSRVFDLASSQVVAAWVDPNRLPSDSLALTRDESRIDNVVSMQTDSESRKQLQMQLASAPPGKRRDVLRPVIEREAAHALGLSATHQFDGSRPLNELGMDSLLAVQLANALSALLGRQLPSTLLFDYPTVDGLTEHLGGEVMAKDTARSSATSQTLQAGTEVLRDVSEAEAEAMLLEELEGLRNLRERS